MKRLSFSCVHRTHCLNSSRLAAVCVHRFLDQASRYVKGNVVNAVSMFAWPSRSAPSHINDVSTAVGAPLCSGSLGPNASTAITRTARIKGAPSRRWPRTSLHERNGNRVGDLRELGVELGPVVGVER